MVLFVLLIFILILTPPVQRYLTSRVDNYLEKKLKTRVDIGRISFGLSGNINLLNVYIEDKTQDTLIAGGKLKAHLNYLKLFSNRVEVKDIELQNITAKVKRILPDTVYNFQFIVDAFATKQTTDTSTGTPLELDISDVSLDNVSLKYNDDVTGSDMFAHIGNLTATFDTLNPYQPYVAIPTFIARNVQARIRQYKPLFQSEPLSKDVTDATKPSTAKFSFGTIDLSKFSLQYENDVSAVYSTVNLGKLKAVSRLIDLQNNRIFLDQLLLENSKTAIRLGKKEATKVVKKEVKQEVVAQKAAGWNFKVAQVQFNNNSIQFDDDNQRQATYGMDYAHLHATGLTLHVNDFVMSPDSTGGKILDGTFREKSGFVLNSLKGNVLYAYNQTYLQDLYIKTPGSEIRRSAVLKYPSFEALTNNFPGTNMDIALVNSKVQVKDILAFAPQLRNHPAMANPNDVWHLNIVAKGTLNELNVQSLQFDGLRNTQINAKGTLSNLMNPNAAGGNFVINRLHTTQTDLSLFTGQRLSTAQVNLPEEFDIKGIINGNAGRLRTNLNVSTSSGFVSVNGSFSNLADPNRTGYNATIQASHLQLGRIMRQPAQFGALTGTFSMNGSGFTPNTINTRFNAKVNSFGYNNYQYHNVRLSGTLRKSAFDVIANANDPNVSFDLTAKGNFSSNPSFVVNGMIDSIKTMPLHFTTQPMVFRGHVDGTVSSITNDNINADVLITRALLVTDKERLPLDTVHFVSGSTGTEKFMRLASDIANVNLQGHYKLSELGTIIQNSIQPYFTVDTRNRKPLPGNYNFSVTADVVYTPLLSTLMPGLNRMDPVHAEGTFSSGGVMQAYVTTPFISYSGNDVSGLDFRAHTSDSGLVVNGTASRLKGSGLDLYNTRINATALNNVIGFNVGTDDKTGKPRYQLSGLVNQPATGSYTIHLNQDSLLLNYDNWAISPDNQIIIRPTAIIAHNFTLQRNGQQLSINSLPGDGDPPLNVGFTNFKLGTITGFVKADTLAMDGTINGTVTFRNLMQQPLFTSNLTISDFSMQQDTVGNINLQVSSTADNRYITNATITGKGNDIALTGSMSPTANSIALDLDLAVRQLQLKTLEGLSGQAITNATGAVNGAIRIAGTANNPIVKGDLNFNKTSFALAVLGSQFFVDNETLSVTENGFYFRSFTVRDSANNAMNINGTINTENYTDFSFQLYINANNFMVMNRAKHANDMYYGKLNISTDLHITGTTAHPVTDGSLSVNDGTNFTFVVPQEEPGIVQRKGVVEFVDMDAPENDTLFRRYDSLNTSGIKGMDVTVNLEIKKEAIFNAVIDEANGDFLNVRGEALLSTGIDPSGKITMVGTYTLEQGAYQISFNFLQRRFDIEKGSTITWTGEPTTAQLNVQAVYVANTAPIDLVQDQIAASTPAIRNTYMQKLPFEVRLNLTGELLRPKVAFDVLLPEKNYGVSNDIITQVQSRLQQIRADQGEVNKQVFSLLLLGRFVGEDPFQSSGGEFNAASYARQSVSKLLSEQLNRLAGGLIQGVDLNFDVASTEDYTTGERRNRTDLNVGLSKRLLNDRLQITVGSNFELEGPQTTSNQKNNNIAGNVAVNYQLSRDGRYMLRFFRKNENVGALYGYVIETGLGFILNVDYNLFKEILHRRKETVTEEGTTTQKGQ